MAGLKKKIYVISDGTGETATAMIEAALVQFELKRSEVIIARQKSVRSTAQIHAIFEQAREERALVVYTVVDPILRKDIITFSNHFSIAIIGLIGPVLLGVGTYLGKAPKSLSGILHGVNENYFKRIEAMEFTLQHDDGKDTSKLEDADLILVGISRTSKTPLSMYLSQQGLKVVNIPIIKGFSLPPELFGVDQKKIIALTIDPEELALIRQNRLGRLRQTQGGDYATLDKVSEEVEYANELFRKNKRWIVFNVTGKALEETASEILRLIEGRRTA